MKASAQDQGAAGRDDYFGYGIVKAKDASDYLTANPCGSTPPPPPPGGDIVLTGNRSKGNRQANLNWTGATGANVDIYVNGSLNNTAPNTGAISFSVNKNTSYTFSVCEEGVTVDCSNDLTL